MRGRVPPQDVRRTLHKLRRCPPLRLPLIEELSAGRAEDTGRVAPWDTRASPSLQPRHPSSLVECPSSGWESGGPEVPPSVCGG